MKRTFYEAPDDGSDPFRGAGNGPDAPDDPTIPVSLRKSAAAEPPTPLSAPQPKAPPAAPGTTGWMRPQPVRRDSNLRAWLLFLAGLALLAGLWVPVRSAYQQYRYKPVAAGLRDADSFIALAYAGVSGGKTRGADEVSRAQFAEHVRLLRERGFHPIGAQNLLIGRDRPGHRRGCLQHRPRTGGHRGHPRRDLLRRGSLGCPAAGCPP